jgi:prolyl-tRNA editing enzyme YbaK/EbsC (Cys-tRNA(Pro) deacylase)
VTPGNLAWATATEHPDLLAEPVATFLSGWAHAESVLVAPIEPDLADTAAFCERYEVALDISANCVVIEGRRGDVLRRAACLVLATNRADVNGVVRRRLDARKASFAAVDVAVAETGMEYGGITPLGLPAGWEILVDSAVVAAGTVVIGSGLRRSKLALPGELLAALPAAEVMQLRI